jgi:ATP-dependent RNA helicase RhlB
MIRHYPEIYCYQERRMKFSEWNLDANLIKGIEEAGYAECMTVQEMTLAKTLKNMDVLVQSQTGSGKTAAFLVSIFELFLRKRSERRMKALIIVPTRELAVQIEEEAVLLGKYLDFNIASFYGGVGYARQEKQLHDGVDIIIGTPGRLIDFGQSGKLSFADMDVLVIDEADRLFDMGFLPDLRKMLKKMKPREQRHTMLFSATLSTRVRQLAWEYMNEAEDITITPENVTVDNITQELYHVGRGEKMNLLLGLLQLNNPKNAIIFTNTKQAAYEISQRLEKNGYKSQYIIGDLPQSKRLRTLEDMKSGKVPFLVATDVAARGLHIDDLELVINYDLPEDSENYVHRIGRTARAGKTGKAISLACERYVYALEGIESFANIKIPVMWAEDSYFVEDKSRGMHFSLERSKHRDEEWTEDGEGGRGRKRRRDSKKGGRSRQERGAPAQSRERTRPERERPGDRKKKRYEKPRPEKAPLREKAPLKENPPLQEQARRDDRRNGQKKKATPPKSMRKSSLDKRLRYYREKYGEDFAATPEQVAKESRKKRSILDRIRGLFGK